MPQSDPIRVFVTHGFEASEDYLRVFEFLESARNFYYRNCSAPEQRLTGATAEAQHEALRQQMATAEVVIALSSLFRAHRDLLMFQLNCAKSGAKPVILLPGFGRELVMPPMVTGLASEQANWDERALVDTIRRQARHEETQRWDTIEFKLD